MRVPPEAVVRPRPRRRTIILAALFGVLVILVIAVQGLAGFYANFLWFHWDGVGQVWTEVTSTKIVLTVVFIAVAFVLVFASLLLVDRVVSRTLFMAPDTDLVRRYQQVVAPHSLALRITVSGLVALALGSGNSSQWQNWILFTHSVPFGTKDPVFHRDIAFYVFQLPFLSFLVDWIFAALLVCLIVTGVAYFVNGALRFQGRPYVEPRATAHLSLILSLMAIERAWAFYFVDRYSLELSHNGVVTGMSYTDSSVRLPAMEFLAIVSLIAFVMLAFNVYQRTLVLPAVAVGLWAFLALTVFVIFPALYQSLRVTPAQSRLEAQPIRENVAATTAAMDIGSVQSESFPANQDLTSGVLSEYSPTLSNVQLWDPTFTAATFSKLQTTNSGYQLVDLTIDRYKVNGKLAPVVIGARALNSAGIGNQTWINTHLQYTAGYGAVVSPANANSTTKGGGNPQFLLSGVPEKSTAPSVSLSKNGTRVYYAPGNSEYVITNTQQSEIAYVQAAGNNPTAGEYTGNGIPMTFGARLAYALHLHDFNMLISKEVQSSSKLIAVPDVRAEVQKALPFLSVDAHPYAVVDHGQLVWLVDAYVTSASYPFAQTAPTDALSPDSGLAGTYNYVRDAVKVEVNAYTGKMQFFSVGTPDPILRAYEAAFPGLIKPLSSLTETDPDLLQHLRYPQDLLTVQAEVYGRYHVTDPAAFYAKSSAWDLSQTSNGIGGSPSASLPTNPFTGATERFTPIYELLQLDGSRSLSFYAVEPLVQYSADDNLKNLSALFVANSSYQNYGKFTSLDTPYQQTQIDGPGLANADILANPDVSQDITFFDQTGSRVSLGTVQILPIADSLLYVRPLYVSAAQTAYPLLQDVLVVYGSQVAIASTLDDALQKIFGNSAGGSGGGTSTPPSTTPAGAAAVSAAVRSYIAEATTDYQSAQAALGRGDLGTYQSEVEAAGRLLNEANALLTSGTTKTKSASAVTPTTTAPPAATATTTTLPAA